MALTAQTTIKNTKLIEKEYSEKAAIDALYDELASGIQSMKNSYQTITSTKFTSGNA